MNCYPYIPFTKINGLKLTSYIKKFCLVKIKSPYEAMYYRLFYNYKLYNSNNFVISVRVNLCNYFFEFTIGVDVNIQNSN